MIGFSALLAALLLADAAGADAGAHDAAGDATVVAPSDAGTSDAAPVPSAAAPAPGRVGRVAGRLLSKGAASPGGRRRAGRRHDHARRDRRARRFQCHPAVRAAAPDGAGRRLRTAGDRRRGVRRRHQPVHVAAHPRRVDHSARDRRACQVDAARGAPDQGRVDADRGDDGRSVPRAQVASRRDHRGMAGGDLRRARLEPGEHRLFPDSVRVPALFHMALGPSVIHPYFFDSLQFYPGGYPAQYGRYVAGIVAADTRGAATDRLHSSVDVRLFDAGALVSAPLPGNGGVVAAARYSYTGELVSLLDQSIRLAYWDYQLRVDRRVGPVQLTLMGFGSHDVLVPGPAPPGPRTSWTSTSTASARAPAFRSPAGRLQGSVAVGNDHTRARRSWTFTPSPSTPSPPRPGSRSRASFSAVDVSAGFDGDITRTGRASRACRCRRTRRTWGSGGWPRSAAATSRTRRLSTTARFGT